MNNLQYVFGEIGYIYIHILDIYINKYIYIYMYVVNKQLGQPYIYFLGSKLRKSIQFGQGMPDGPWRVGELELPGIATSRAPQ